VIQKKKTFESLCIFQQTKPLSSYFAEALQAQTLNRPYKTKGSHAKLETELFKWKKVMKIGGLEFVYLVVGREQFRDENTNANR